MRACTVWVHLWAAAVLPKVDALRAATRTPPLGFNTWVQFGMSTNATILTDTADAIARLGLKDLGYQFVNSDDGWNGGREKDSSGQQGAHAPWVPTSRFPNGMKAVADHIHGVGLKLGLYTARATRTCGGRAGSCGNEVVDAQRLANWTVDYLKDDSCGGCRTGPTDEPHADYAAMQSAINSVDREIVLTTEGHPDVTKVYNNGCCGNVRRIGTDLSPQWQAVMSLVDHAAGLWPFAHNGSLGVNGSTSGFWNGIEIMGIGVDWQNGQRRPGWGDFVAERGPLDAAQARTHYSLWGIMKSHLLLGNDLKRVGNATLSILLQREVVEINQDHWGRQARRIDAQRAKNTSLVMYGPRPPEGSQNGGVFDPVQIMQLCDPSEPLQQWRWRNVTQSIRNGGATKTVNGSVLYVVDPSSATGQAWCLTNWAAGPEPCNVTSAGELTKGASVRDWKFTPVEHPSAPLRRAWNFSDGPAARDTANIGYSNQPYSSGPVPHSRWLSKFEPEPPTNTIQAGPYLLDLKALGSEKGGMIQSVDTHGIIDDDNAGTVKIGGEFCLAIHSGSTLEVWGGLLSPSSSGQHRWAVAMVNRSPSTDTIKLDFSILPDLHLVDLASEDMLAKSTRFAVQDVWLGVNHSSVAGEKGWSRLVDAHDTALLIVSKTS